MMSDPDLCVTSTSRPDPSTNTAHWHLQNPTVLQFLRNAVWHYRELDSGASEEPVKDIPVKQEDCGVTVTLVAFQSVRSVRYDFTLFRMLH